MIFKDNTIQKRVMQTIKTRITTAQKAYDEKCVSLEEKYETDLEVLNTKLANDKESVADSLVEGILGK